MGTALTRRQQDVFDFLCEHRERFDYPPTLEEVCHGLGLKSRGSMHKQVQALVNAGLVESMGRKQRGIRLREGVCSGADEGVPFLGYIAAGRPIEAIENPEPMEVPEYLRGTGDTFVLRVKGDSMVDEGILDGDWVVIERRDYADNGEIVVALVDGEEATLKRLEQQPGEVVLHPANADMASMRYSVDRVQIQGVLVGQMRSY